MQRVSGNSLHMPMAEFGHYFSTGEMGLKALGVRLVCASVVQLPSGFRIFGIDADHAQSSSLLFRERKSWKTTHATRVIVHFTPVTSHDTLHTLHQMLNSRRSELDARHSTPSTRSHTLSTVP